MRKPSNCDADPCMGKLWCVIIVAEHGPLNSYLLHCNPQGMLHVGMWLQLQSLTIASWR